MKWSLLFIGLVIAQTIASEARNLKEEQDSCLEAIRNYLINAPTEPWSEEAYVDRIFEDQCRVYVPWAKDWPNGEYCSFYYIVNFADRKVLWKQDISCNWNGY